MSTDAVVTAGIVEAEPTPVESIPITQPISGGNDNDTVTPALLENQDDSDLPTREASVDLESDASVEPSSTIQPTTSDLDNIQQKEPQAIADPTVPQKKKRLTLQERLALAANKGGKKPAKKLPLSAPLRDSSTEVTPRTSIDTQERPSIDLDLALEVKSALIVEGDVSLVPLNYLELDHSALLEVIKTGLEKFSNLKTSLQKEVSVSQDLKNKLASKELELKLKDNKITELSKSSGDSNLSKKLLEKDNLIKELMEEGSKLSMTELNLNNTIKTLKKKTNEDSQMISDLQEKLDSTLEKLATFEEKEIELKEFDSKREQLNSDFKTLESKYNKAQDELNKVSQQYKDLKAQRFEQQLESTKAKLDEQLKKNKDLTQQLNELNIRLKLAKDQSKNELDELEERIKREQRKYKSLQEETATEIKRLEDKMELLRIMTESSSTSKNDDLGNESFKKLAASNELLQSQYTQAQENWKFIESSYMNKLALAEKDINTLKQKDLNSMKKIKVLSSDFKSKNDELEEALEREGSLIGELAKMGEILKQKDLELDNLKQEIVKLSKELETTKSNFAQQLQTELAAQKDTLEREMEQQSNKSLDGPLHQQALYLNDLLPNPSFLKTRSVSNMSWNDNIAFGESSTTPRSSHANSRKPSSSILNQFGVPNNNPLRTPINESSARFFESPKAGESPSQNYDNFFNSAHHEDSYFDDEFGDDYQNQSPTSQTSSKYTLNRDNPQGNLIRNSSGVLNNKHIQIISKLSSQIRRMEIESVTLKDEISNLNNLKNESNEEILRLMKENSEVQFLKTDKESLEKRVTDLDKKYQKTLELLGEKSERVEELKADVDDLKQLCREQVQQLVELQTKN